jgi:ADP-ribose pyrophosphatase YjhB (NUDIX family)
MAISAEPPYPVIFVERAAHLRNHPGQIGLPGGSVDAADGEDRTRTALRELHEEVGIVGERVTIVGQLPDVYQRSNNFVVTPLVGVLHPETPLTIDAAETAAVFTVPLAAIVAFGAVHAGIETIDGRTIETFIFDYGSLHVWGLTARILHDFVAAWNQAGSALRAATQSALAASSSSASRC